MKKITAALLAIIFVISASKYDRKIEIVVVYEVMWKHYTWFAWQSGYGNWKCTQTIYFE